MILLNYFLTCSVTRTNYLVFRDWTFAMEKEKENTARIVLFRELGILNWYTFEATFFGSDALGKAINNKDSDAELNCNESEDKDNEMPEQNEDNYSDSEVNNLNDNNMKSEPNEKEQEFQLDNEEIRNNK